MPTLAANMFGLTGHFTGEVIFPYEKIMRFKKSPQLPGAGRTRAWHHHESHMLTSPGAILLSKMACQPKHIGRQCIAVILKNAVEAVYLFFISVYLPYLNSSFMEIRSTILPPLVSTTLYVNFLQKYNT